jgi:post-segregation antitoxin (ccd killing protein)
MSNKVRTTLTLNRDVVNKAKELDINLSAAAERGIIEYIKEIRFINTNLRRNISN